MKTHQDKEKTFLEMELMRDKLLDGRKFTEEQIYPETYEIIYVNFQTKEVIYKEYFNN